MILISRTLRRFPSPSLLQPSANLSSGTRTKKSNVSHFIHDIRWSICEITGKEGQEKIHRASAVTLLRCISCCPYNWISSQEIIATLKLQTGSCSISPTGRFLYVHVLNWPMQNPTNGAFYSHKNVLRITLFAIFSIQFFLPFSSLCLDSEPPASKLQQSHSDLQG